MKIDEVDFRAEIGLPKNEELYLIMTEWYEGDPMTKFPGEEDRINLKEHSPDLVIQEIKEKTPDHFHFIIEETEIHLWIERNRDVQIDVENIIEIGDTDTLDINQPHNHLNTLGGFSGTMYELHHEIEK